MSIYGKLQEARVKLQSTPLQKSGKNTYSGYSYFELSDFMPTVQELFLEHGLCGVLSFGQEVATLTIHDVEADDKTITFTSPMSTAALKGCHEVQNLGAVESYIRRYLWTTALEIVENDVLDATTGKEPPAKKPEPVAKQEAKPAPTAAPTVPSKPVAPIAGLAGEWQIVAPGAPAEGADPFEWLNVVSDAAHVTLGFATTEADVLTIFRKNKVLFDTVKAVDPGAFELMMAQFADVRKKFQGA
jgi:hypothetical protein